jgi:hypothetical protein
MVRVGRGRQSTVNGKTLARFDRILTYQLVKTNAPNRGFDKVSETLRPLPTRTMIFLCYGARRKRPQVETENTMTTEQMFIEQMSARIADTEMVATLTVNGNWKVVCTDHFDGPSSREEGHVKIVEAVWTNQQIAAVYALFAGMGEESETPPEVTKYLYSIAEPAIAGWPNNVRPIP